MVLKVQLAPINNFSITQNGKVLDESKYKIDLKNRTFASTEDNLVLDFTGLSGWTFKTTGWVCIFHTGCGCIFHTGSFCTFTTLGNCTFTTLGNCTFTTLGDCTFNTDSDCTFDTGKGCVFMLYNINTCKFKKYDDNISIILDRKDNQSYKLTKELIQLLKITNN